MQGNIVYTTNHDGKIHYKEFISSNDFLELIEIILRIGNVKQIIIE